MGHSYSVYRCSKVLHNAFFFFVWWLCKVLYFSLLLSLFELPLRSNSAET